MEESVRRGTILRFKGKDPHYEFSSNRKPLDPEELYTVIDGYYPNSSNDYYRVILKEVRNARDGHNPLGERTYRLSSFDIIWEPDLESTIYESQI